ncbi:MAG: MFS transporter [Phycisphaeraceae bacterium]
MNASRIDLVTLSAAVLATSMTFIDATAINQALPAIGEALDASTFQAILIVGAFALTLAVLLLPAGAVADRLGRRLVLRLGLIAFALASAACALSSDATWLTVARVVQGAGGAMIVPASLAVLTAAHSPHCRGRVIGVWSAWCAMATVAGPLLGGMLAEAGLWRMIFLLNVPLAVVALLCLHLMAPEQQAPAPAPAQAKRRPFVMIPSALWQQSTMRAAAGATVTLYTAMYGLLLVVPLALISGAGYRADHAALAQLPLVMLLIVVCPLAGRWADRSGPRAPVCVGCGLAVAGLAWLIVGGIGTGLVDYVTRLLVPFALLGAGMGMCVVPLSTTLMNQAGEAALAAGGALNALLTRLAAAIAVAAFGGLLLGSGVAFSGAVNHDPLAWSAALRWTVILAGMLCVVTGMIAAHYLHGRVMTEASSTSRMVEGWS